MQGERRTVEPGSSHVPLVMMRRMVLQRSLHLLRRCVIAFCARR